MLLKLTSFKTDLPVVINSNNIILCYKKQKSSTYTIIEMKDRDRQFSVKESPECIYKIANRINTLKEIKN